MASNRELIEAVQSGMAFAHDASDELLDTEGVREILLELNDLAVELLEVLV